MNLDKAQQISKEIAALNNKISVFSDAEKIVDDAEVLIELSEEENDESVLAEIETDLKKAEDMIEDIRLKSLLSGKYRFASSSFPILRTPSSEP